MAYVYLSAVDKSKTKPKTPINWENLFAKGAQIATDIYNIKQTAKAAGKASVASQAQFSPAQFPSSMPTYTVPIMQRAWFWPAVIAGGLVLIGGGFLILKK